MKLKKKFIAIFTIFAIIPLIISGFIVISAVQNSNKNEAYGRLNEELLVVQNSVQENIRIISNQTGKIDKVVYNNYISNYYKTDSVSRVSKVMSQCRDIIREFEVNYKWKL